MQPCKVFLLVPYLFCIGPGYHQVKTWDIKVFNSSNQVKSHHGQVRVKFQGHIFVT